MWFVKTPISRCYYYPFLQMRKLRHRKMNNLSKSSQLISGQTKIPSSRPVSTVHYASPKLPQQAASMNECLIIPHCVFSSLISCCTFSTSQIFNTIGLNTEIVFFFSLSQIKADGSNYSLDRGFPGGATDKEHACQCRRHKRSGIDPWIKKIPWRRKWKPTLIFMPGEFHGQRSLVGYSP